MVLWL